MENLEIALIDKKLEDLKSDVSGVATFQIEPTKEEIETILGHLKEGKDYKWIRRNVRRIVMKDAKQVSAQGFSRQQIQDIDRARQAKIVELSPKEEELFYIDGPRK